MSQILSQIEKQIRLKALNLLSDLTTLLMRGQVPHFTDEEMDTEATCNKWFNQFKAELGGLRHPDSQSLVWWSFPSAVGSLPWPKSQWERCQRNWVIHTIGSDFGSPCRALLPKACLLPTLVSAPTLRPRIFPVYLWCEHPKWSCLCLACLLLLGNRPILFPDFVVREAQVRVPTRTSIIGCLYKWIIQAPLSLRRPWWIRPLG